MQRRRPWRVAGLLVPAALDFSAAGCCGRPPASIVEVNLALSRAKEACAAVYAPRELATVEGRVEEMNRLADTRRCRKARSAAGPIRPDVLALSASMSFNLPHVRQTTAAVRACHPDLPIWLGGQMFNWVGHDIEDEFPGARVFSASPLDELEIALSRFAAGSP